MDEISPNDDDFTQIVTELPIFSDNIFFEEFPSSAITDTIYTLAVIGMEFWNVNETSLNGEKEFSAGKVELQIRDRFDLTNFAEIAYQAKEVIAHSFGEETLKLHYALAGIAFRKLEPWKKEIKVSASKLLEEFGEDKRVNTYISKDERTNQKKKSKYLSKTEKLKKIAHHAYLLKRLEVLVREWKVKSKGIFTVELSNLWDIFAIREIIQKDLNEKQQLLDIEIIYRPGLWFEKFAGGKFLREFGYLTSEVLKLDTYHDLMALRFAFFALFGLQQHKSGRYKVETLLKRTGYEKVIEKAKTNRNARLSLKRSFDRALKKLESFEYKYGFVYDENVPEWVNHKQRKPRNWFEKWLQLYGTLYQPVELPQRYSLKSFSNYSVKNQPEEEKEKETVQIESPFINFPFINLDEKEFGELIKDTRIARQKSLRAMAKQINISPSRLSQIENGKYRYKTNIELKIQMLNYLNLI